MLGGIAVLIAWIPCVNVLALIMAVVGLVLAGVALFGALGDKRIARGIPVAGVSVSSLAIVVFIVSWAVVAVGAKRGAEHMSAEMREASAKGRLEMVARAEVLLEEAKAFEDDPTLSEVQRQQLADATTRIEEKLDDENTGLMDNVAFGMLLADLEIRLQALKNVPTTLPATAPPGNLPQ